jgi:purine-binding chemotaxis protein CheW
MSQEIEAVQQHSVDSLRKGDLDDYVTFTIDQQMFGVPILKVQDILRPDSIASIPLAPPEIKGSINLRGRIVTVIDVRVRLGIEPREDMSESMGVTIEHNNDLYTLLVDKIGDAISLDSKNFEKNPGTLDADWRDFAVGVFRLEERLMVVLDVETLLDISTD